MTRALLVFTFLLLVANAVAQRSIIHCGKLIDVKNKKLIENVSVIIEGNKIVDIAIGFVEPRNTDKVIDLKKNTVMPGLMDMHVHMDYKQNEAQLPTGLL